jgi:hypothetical protein
MRKSIRVSGRFRVSGLGRILRHYWRQIRRRRAHLLFCHNAYVALRSEMRALREYEGARVTAPAERGVELESGEWEGRGEARDETRLLVRRRAVKPRFKGVTGVVLFGGACARWRGCLLCARAPGLTSVRDPGWLRAGDMMFDGVVPLGEALRPLDLSRPSTRRWRQRVFGSGPRRICVSEGSTRTGVRRTGALDRRARAGCGSSA